MCGGREVNRIFLDKRGQGGSSLEFSEASLSLLTFECHMQSTSIFSRDVLNIIISGKIKL